MKTIWLVEIKSGRRWYPCLPWHNSRADARKEVSRLRAIFPTEKYRIQKWARLES